MAVKKRILVSPLDWGLGHATRMVPVIRLLKQAGADVVLGADGFPLSFLRQAFPDTEWFRFPGFRPEYSARFSLPLKMAFSIPKMLKEAQKAHRFLEHIIAEKKIDAVISDNRYELWSEKIPTIFITHQLNILLPHILALGRPIVRKLMYDFIKKHNELWIPDFAGAVNLSGALSHVKKKPLTESYFIGPLSRFEKSSQDTFSDPGEKQDILCLLSGPEPQRTIFEQLLIRQLENTSIKASLLTGKPGSPPDVIQRGDLKIYSHASDKKILQLMHASDLVICRSGYSSIMDLTATGTRAILVPTPGQPEQNYLARTLKKKGFYYSCQQNRFHLQQAIAQSQNYTPLRLEDDYTVLKERIDHLLTRLP